MSYSTRAMRIIDHYYHDDYSEDEDYERRPKERKSRSSRSLKNISRLKGKLGIFEEEDFRFRRR